jgi:hypothetical protein
VRTSNESAVSGMFSPWAQVTPTAPYPVTFCGRLVRRAPPPGAAATRACGVVRMRPWAGPRLPYVPVVACVSGTSRSLALTGPVGTLLVLSASSPYADIRAPASGPDGSLTTSRLTTLTAGVRAAHTTARASSCWHAVTNRARKGVGPEGMRGCSKCEGKSHTSSNFHTGHRSAGRVSE